MSQVRKRHFLSLPDHPRELFSTNPSVSASDSNTRVAALERRAIFLADYRAALVAWLEGDHAAVFPEGTWLMWRRFGAKCAGAP